METRSNHILVGGVVLALLAAIVGFTIWIAGLGGGTFKEYDIFFKQSVEGLTVGGGVSYAGVPSGQVKQIELWKADPGFVRVRIAVREDTPILQGTTASLNSSFTGPSTILLNGAVKGAPEITDAGLAGVPVIPTKNSGLGAIFTSAPQLMERLSTLSERLTELVNDKNQKAFGNILHNTDRMTGELATVAPDLKATLKDTRATVAHANAAIDQFAAIAGSTNTLINTDGKSVLDDLRQTVGQAQKSLNTLDSAIGDVRPGLQAFSNQTIPEVGQLVRDLRVMSDSLGSVATKLDQGGATAILGAPALPDYKPARTNK
jgi:phospholipid/cholesterol/gamma-HCH transport system substrate-binding protein